MDNRNRYEHLASPKLTASLYPDRIIVALGSYPHILPIPGADQRHGSSGMFKSPGNIGTGKAK